MHGPDAVYVFVVSYKASNGRETGQAAFCDSNNASRWVARKIDEQIDWNHPHVSKWTWDGEESEATIERIEINDAQALLQHGEHIPA